MSFPSNAFLLQKIDRLKSSLSMTFTGKSASKHKFFADDREERERLSKTLAEKTTSTTAFQSQEEGGEILSDGEKVSGSSFCKQGNNGTFTSYSRDLISI